MSRMGSSEARRRARRQFSDEFMAGAVRLVLDQGKTIGAVARELDLTPSSAANWVRHAQADQTKGRTGLTTEERAELAGLRKENRELRMERDILKNVWSAPPLQRSASSDHTPRGFDRRDLLADLVPEHELDGRVLFLVRPVTPHLKVQRPTVGR